MILDRYRQQPNDLRRREIDYTEWLAEDEVLTGTVVTSITPTTVPPFTLSSVTIDPDGKVLEYFAGGGLSGTDYVVMFRVTTDDGQVREDEVEVTVEEDT